MSGPPKAVYEGVRLISGSGTFMEIRIKRAVAMIQSVEEPIRRPILEKLRSSKLASVKNSAILALKGADLSPEQKVLDHLLGNWDQTHTIFKSARTSEQEEGTGTASCSRILNGRFVQVKYENSDGMTGLILETYDAQRNCYRRWDFNSFGDSCEQTGEWNADARCMTWNRSPEDGRTSTTTDRFVGDDSTEWSLVLKDRNGEVQLRVEGKGTRTK